VNEKTVKSSVGFAFDLALGTVIKMVPFTKKQKKVFIHLYYL